MKYRNHCLAKWGRGDGDSGTYYNAKDTWNIVPLFKRGEVRWNKIMAFDNSNSPDTVTRQRKLSLR